MREARVVPLNKRIDGVAALVAHSKKTRTGPGALHCRSQRGFSIVELMIAAVIGLLLLGGMTLIFVNSNRSYAELQNTSQQIENGRYAIDLLHEDIRHAGYYGQYVESATAAAALPDPCLIPTAATSAAYLATLAFPLQGYDAPDFDTRPDIAATTCATYGLTNANLLPGSDVLVVRRSHTEVLPALNSLAGTPIASEVYLQETVDTAEIQIGNSGSAIGTTKKADGAAATILKKDATTAADIRKFHAHVYFLAPCSRPSDGSTVCTGAADDDGRPIPTLKRLELTADAGTTTFSIVPLVEGIENLQLEYGVDDIPEIPTTTFTPVSPFGDGSPDNDYLRNPTARALPTTNPPTNTQWQNVMALQIYLLVRNTQATAGYVDKKVYNLGLAGTLDPANDAFARHVFNAAVRVVNPSSRRESPR